MRVPVASMMPASTLPLTAISPTSVEPVVTAAVDIDRGLLLARQAQGIDEVCGYVSGDNNLEVRCSDNYQCQQTSDGFAVFGCCNDISCTGNVFFTCFDSFTNGCNDEVNKFICDMQYALECPTACVTHVLMPAETGLRDTTTFFSYSCGESPTRISILRSATNGPPPGATQDPGDNDSGSIGGSGSSGGDRSSSSGSQIGKSGKDPNATSTSSSGGISSSAIAGIVVAVIVIALAGMALGWYYIKKREPRKTAEMEIKKLNEKKEIYNITPSEAGLMSESGDRVAEYIHNQANWNRGA